MEFDRVLKLFEVWFKFIQSLYFLTFNFFKVKDIFQVFIRILLNEAKY